MYGADSNISDVEMILDMDISCPLIMNLSQWKIDLFVSLLQWLLIGTARVSHNTLQ